MPKAFLDCVKKGGKVWTKKLGGGRYVHKCHIGNQTFTGHIKTKKIGDKK